MNHNRLVGPGIKTASTCLARGGFTLVEVVVALFVLAVGLLGLMSTLVLTTRMIVTGQRRTAMAAYAVELLEIRVREGCAIGSEVLERNGIEAHISSGGGVGAGGELILVLTANVPGATLADTFASRVSCAL